MKNDNNNHQRARIWCCLGFVGLACLLTPMAVSGPLSDARYMVYDGSDPMFSGVYTIGEPYLPPSIRIQPLKASKDAVVAAVDTIVNGGFDDQIGAVAFSSILEYTEPLTTNFNRVRTKLLGTPLGVGGGLAIGAEAARLELLSIRARTGAQKMMVLVTDGKSDPTGVLTQVQMARAAGITVHVIGVGQAVDTVFLSQLASVGGGEAIFVDAATPSWQYAPQLQAALEKVASSEFRVGLIR